jgi:hypothetical protein
VESYCKCNWWRVAAGLMRGGYSSFVGVFVEAMTSTPPQTYYLVV